jgi:hypothetical protein
MSRNPQHNAGQIFKNVDKQVANNITNIMTKGFSSLHSRIDCNINNGDVVMLMAADRCR